MRLSEHCSTRTSILVFHIDTRCCSARHRLRGGSGLSRWSSARIRLSRAGVGANHTLEPSAPALPRCREAVGWTPWTTGSHPGHRATLARESATGCANIAHVCPSSAQPGCFDAATGGPAGGTACGLDDSGRAALECFRSHAGHRAVLGDGTSHATSRGRAVLSPDPTSGEGGRAPSVAPAALDRCANRRVGLGRRPILLGGGLGSRAEVCSRRRLQQTGPKLPTKHFSRRLQRQSVLGRFGYWRAVDNDWACRATRRRPRQTCGSCGPICPLARPRRTRSCCKGCFNRWAAGT